MVTLLSAAVTFVPPLSVPAA